MSHSARFTDYRAVLTTPGALPPVVTALLARLPIAMVGLSLLLYVQRQTGSFAVAGLVSAGVLAGVATGSVAQGRLMDRLGPTRPLLVTSSLFTVAVTAGMLAIESRAPDGVLVALAFGIGLSQPTVSSASRALWTRLLPPGSARQAAYAYEAISLEVCFILGPALAGVLIALPWPGTGVVIGSACMVAGGIGFALAPVVRRQAPAKATTERAPAEGSESRWQGPDGQTAADRDAGPAGEISTSAEPPTSRGGRLLGALVSPGMRTVVLAVLGFGVTIGFIEVAVPAAATRAGHAPAGGLMLALWSLGSVIFGIAYAARPWPREMRLRQPVLLGAFALLVAPLAIPTSLLGLGALLLVPGLLITPQATTHSAVLELVAPRGTTPEAFGWVITAATFGLALGQSGSGWLVEHVGIRSAFLASSAAGLLIAALVWARRKTVRLESSLSGQGSGADQPAHIGDDDRLRPVA
jgi:MFS family permease